MKFLAISFFFTSFLFFSSASHAQSNISDSANENSCVIQLYVANRYGVTGTTGFLGTMLGGGLLGTLAVDAANKEGNEKRKTALMEVISPEYIKSVFLETDLVSRLKASSIQINYSDLPSEKKKINESI